MANEENQTKERNKQMAVEQRTVLQDLFKGKNRPNPYVEINAEIFMLDKEVIDKWRAFVR